MPGDPTWIQMVDCWIAYNIRYIKFQEVPSLLSGVLGSDDI